MEILPTDHSSCFAIFSDVYEEIPWYIQEQREELGSEIMVEMNMIQALNSALDIQLKNDDSVIIFGEDGFFGGVFRVTDTHNKNMENNVFDSEAEGGIAATAFGMGINGLGQ